MMGPASKTMQQNLARETTMGSVNAGAVTGAAPPKVTGSADIPEWRPEDPQFWEAAGKRVAYRNLAISVPALLCGFAVWGMWGTITV